MPAYLDHNATSVLRPEAAAAMADALAAGGNASSVHAAGRAARARVERARAEVAALVGAPPEAVVFTAGGTEANALALAGTGRGRVLVSAVEHDSVRAARPDAEVIPVDGDGVVDLDRLARMLSADPRPALVSVMAANNETGTLQPVAEVAAVARAAGALVHCDAVQAAGRIALDVDALGVDYVTLSAHKLGGPQGAGALVVRDGAPLAAMLRGGAQENGRRAGTENVPAIAGFGAAAALGVVAMDGIRTLRDRLEAEALRRVPGVRVFGAGAARLANTSLIAMPGVPAETQVIALDLAGVMVSAGAACASGKARRSPVLDAMGIDEATAARAIRVSLGWNTTADDVEAFLAAWVALAARAGRPAATAAPAASMATAAPAASMATAA